METPVLSPECPFTGVPCMYTRLYPSVLRFLRYWTVVKYRHTLIGQSLHNTYYYLCLSSSHHVKFMNSTWETECYLFGCGGCAGSLLRVLGPYFTLHDNVAQSTESQQYSDIQRWL
jgi:hypothetical protein